MFLNASKLSFVISCKALYDNYFNYHTLKIVILKCYIYETLVTKIIEICHTNEKRTRNP